VRTNSLATSAVAGIVTKPDCAALDRGAADGHSDNRGLSAAALSASINAPGGGERSAQRTLRFRVLGLWFLPESARPLANRLNGNPTGEVPILALGDALAMEYLNDPARS